MADLFNRQPILPQIPTEDTSVPYSDSGDEQAFPESPVQQYSMPRGSGIPEMVYSDPKELSQLAQHPGLLAPADPQTAMTRVIMDGRQGLTPKNATSQAIKQFGHQWQGDYGTDYSMTYDNGPHVAIIPTIWNGVVHSTNEGINHYNASKTPQKPLGEHFGIFDGPTERLTGYANSNAYAGKFHARSQYKSDGTLYQGPGRESKRKISDIKKGGKNASTSSNQ